MRRTRNAPRALHSEANDARVYELRFFVPRALGQSKSEPERIVHLTADHQPPPKMQLLEGDQDCACG